MHIFKQFRWSSVVLGGFLLSFWSFPVQAVEVPGGDINFSASKIFIKYTAENGAADFGCFGHTNGNGIAFPRNLSDIGITSLEQASDIVSGGAGTDDCFQQSGVYEVKFQLVDMAGNTTWLPNATDWYDVDVQPSVPDLDETTLDTDATGTEDCAIDADGVTTCDVEIEFRDSFGNLVVQLKTPSQIKVFFDTPVANIDIDGLFDPVDPAAIVDANNAFANTSSADTFLDHVLVGNSSQALSAINGTTTNISGLALKAGSPGGQFVFTIKSRVPSIKLLDDTDPAAGSGVYRQQLNFSLQTPQIDPDGKVNTGATWDLDNAVQGKFSFLPLVTAEPEIEGAGNADDNIIWEEPTSVTTKLTKLISGSLSPVSYLLYTPFDDYHLKERHDDGSGGLTTPVYYTQPIAGGSYGSAHALTSGDTGSIPLFTPSGGAVGASTSNEVGLGSQVQYTLGSAGIRHNSLSSGSDPLTPETACGDPDFIECFPFIPSGEARIIGADIEGGIRASEGKTFYKGLSDEVGTKATYSGETTNGSLRTALDSAVESARRGAPDASVFTGDQTYQSGSGLYSYLSGAGDLVAIVSGDVILDNPTLPAGKKTLIIIDGNLFIKGDATYTPSATDSFGVVVYNTTVDTSGSIPATGHIFVHPDVQTFAGTYYADGSLISPTPGQYAGLVGGSAPSALSYTENDKTKQLVLNGVIWSKNTLGGSFPLLEDDKMVSPWNPGGETDITKARLFDLHFVRRYRGDGTPNCTPGSVSGCDSNENAFVIRLDGKVSAKETSPPIFKTTATISR